MIMTDELKDLLTRLWEYMGDIADINDTPWEDGTPRPNKAAVLRAEIDAILEKL